MENTENATKKEWYSIREAAEYMDVGERTLYRWMRDGKITFRKVGDSTRFCLNNLREIAKAYSLRADDHEGQTPAALSAGKGGWSDLLANADQGANSWTNYAILADDLGRSPKSVTDHDVIAQTLPQALEYLWKDYTPVTR